MRQTLARWLPAGSFVRKSGTTSPGWIHAFGENRAVAYVDPTDPAEIAKKIDMLLDDTERLRKMSSIGKQYVMTRHNWGAEAERIVTLYRRLFV
jgi:glycosyltransferase involved in cell wall biosynthesis